MLVDASAFHADEPAIGPLQRSLMLKTFPGFAQLGPSELALLASICRERFFPKGSTMLEPGKPVMSMFLIVDGLAQVIRHGRVAQELGTRTVVGGLGALTHDPQGTHAVAGEDTYVLEIDAEDMQDVFEDNFRVTQGVLIAMARTLRDLQIALGGGSDRGSTRKFFEAVTTPKPLSLIEKMFFLRKTTNFSQINIEALASLAGHSKEARYDAGTTLWTLGDHADSGILIMDGSVTCTPATGDPYDYPVGYIVGTLDGLSRGERWYTCEAKTDLRVLVQRRDDLFDVLEDHADMANMMLRGFAHGIGAMVERVAAQQAAEERRSDVPPSG